MRKLLLAVALLAPSTALADKDLSEPTDGTTWDCANDATVNVNYGEATFTFTGECKEINVNGSTVQITLDSVETLNVNGASNVIKTTALHAANINGTKNKVTYKKVLGKGKKPKVASVGKGNAVTKVK
ncbi:MAG TPA: DUF3060 domain-containing protein [Kofleriaceae bacterium]|nr:DUF3060 domain-containing protein [Kofleriaceae bacterium]